MFFAGCFEDVPHKSFKKLCTKFSHRVSSAESHRWRCADVPRESAHVRFAVVTDRNDQKALLEYVRTLFVCSSPYMALECFGKGGGVEAPSKWGVEPSDVPSAKCGIPLTGSQASLHLTWTGSAVAHSLSPLHTSQKLSGS